MKHLKDVVLESLLDDEDEIMDRADDSITNPFKILARTPKEVCHNNSKFTEILRGIEKLIKTESKLVEDYKKAVSLNPSLKTVADANVLMILK